MFLRRLAQPMMHLARVKETTGLVGLEVVPNAREVLIDLYTKTLVEIKKVPEHTGYRKAVECFTNHRLQVCREEEDWEGIERRLQSGQVEEIIEEARDELTLIDKMIEWDDWDVPDGFTCEITIDETPIPKHAPKHVPIYPPEYDKTMEAVAGSNSQFYKIVHKKYEPEMESKKDEPSVESKK